MYAPHLHPYLGLMSSCGTLVQGCMGRRHLPFLGPPNGVGSTEPKAVAAPMINFQMKGESKTYHHEHGQCSHIQIYEAGKGWIALP